MQRPAKRRRHECCAEGLRGELCELYEALMASPGLWGKDLCLNSDGMRLLRVMLRLLMEEAPWARRLVRRTWRRPCRETLVRLGEVFYRCPPPEPPLLWQPYKPGPGRRPWPRQGA